MFRSLAMCTFSRWWRSDGPSYQGILSERLTTLSPWRAAIGMTVRSGTLSFEANAANSLRISSYTVLCVVDEIHLVHRHDEVRNPQQRDDEGVAPALLEHPLAGVHEDDGQVRSRRAGDHVPGVLDVARACPR